MFKLERIDKPDISLLTAMEGQQSQMWTALPGIIQSFDVATMTCEVQPAIQARLTNAETQERTWVNLPKLVDCPIQFPAGHNTTITFPITLGDECLVVFASRCIDAWFQSGGHENQQAIMRMHDLSDGFVLLGFRSLPRVLTNISTTDIQIRSDDGNAFIGLNPATHTVTITAAAININGPVNIQGNVVTTGTFQNNGVNISSTHVHSDPQGGNTGVPH